MLPHPGSHRLSTSAWRSSGRFRPAAFGSTARQVFWLVCVLLIGDLAAAQTAESEPTMPKFNVGAWVEVKYDTQFVPASVEQQDGDVYYVQLLGRDSARRLPRKMWVAAVFMRKRGSDDVVGGRVLYDITRKPPQPTLEDLKAARGGADFINGRPQKWTPRPSSPPTTQPAPDAAPAMPIPPRQPPAVIEPKRVTAPIDNARRPVHVPPSPPAKPPVPPMRLFPCPDVATDFQLICPRVPIVPHENTTDPLWQGVRAAPALDLADPQTDYVPRPTEYGPALPERLAVTAAGLQPDMRPMMHHFVVGQGETPMGLLIRKPGYDRPSLIEVFDIATGVVQGATVLPSELKVLAISPNGRRIFLTTDKPTRLQQYGSAVLEWRQDRWQVIVDGCIPTTFTNNGMHPEKATFVDNDHLLIPYGPEPTLWRLENGVAKMVWRSKGGQLGNIYPAQQGRILIAISNEHVRLLDSNTGKVLLHLNPPKDMTFNEGFLDDSGRLLLLQGNISTVWILGSVASQCEMISKLLNRVSPCRWLSEDVLIDERLTCYGAATGQNLRAYSCGTFVEARKGDAWVLLDPDFKPNTPPTYVLRRYRLLDEQLTNRARSVTTAKILATQEHYRPVSLDIRVKDGAVQAQLEQMVKTRVTDRGYVLSNNGRQTIRIESSNEETEVISVIYTMGSGPRNATVRTMNLTWWHELDGRMIGEKQNRRVGGWYGAMITLSDREKTVQEVLDNRLAKDVKSVTDTIGLRPLHQEVYMALGGDWIRLKD